MKKSVIVLLADGFEEVEAITPIDYLRRAGIDVTTLAIGANTNVKSARNIDVKADALLTGLSGEGKLSSIDWDGVVVPGGLPGADNLAASNETGTFLMEMVAAGKLVSAICAAPARVLAPLGILTGKNFTCYPGEEEKVLAPDSAIPGAAWKQDRVVVDGNIITSRSAGTAGEFSLAIIAWFLGKEEADNLAGKVLMSGWLIGNS